MKAFLLKDLLTQRRYSRSLGIILLCYLVFFLVGRTEASLVSGMITILLAMASLSLFSYDEASKWDLFAMTLPVERGVIVASRYLLAFSFPLLGTLLSVTIAAVRGAKPEDYSAAVLIFCFAAFSLSLALPLMYRFGAARGRLLAIGIFALITLCIFAAAKLTEVSFLERLPLWLFFAPIPFAVGISFLVSRRIYLRKEL